VRTLTLALSFALAACASSISEREASIRITAANDLPIEHEAAAQLQELLKRYNLDRWINTDTVVIESRAIPHSHPVLTLNTRYVHGDDLAAMSTFVHEQGHWYFEAHDSATQDAIAELGALFPDTPALADGGARDRQSTLLHLMVCTLEYDAMTSLVGEERAHQSLADRDIYRWVYARVLSDEDGPRIRAVMATHGLNTY